MKENPEETPHCASGNALTAAESLSRSQFSNHCSILPQFHPVIANTQLFLHALETQNTQRCVSHPPGRTKTKTFSDIENKCSVHQAKAASHGTFSIAAWTTLCAHVVFSNLPPLPQQVAVRRTPHFKRTAELTHCFTFLLSQSDGPMDQFLMSIKCSLPLNPPCTNAFHHILP